MLAIWLSISWGNFSKFSTSYASNSSCSKSKIPLSTSSLVSRLSVLVVIIGPTGVPYGVVGWKTPSVLFLLACIDAESAPNCILETPATWTWAFVSVFAINSSIPTSLPYEVLKLLVDNSKPFLPWLLTEFLNKSLAFAWAIKISNFLFTVSSLSLTSFFSNLKLVHTLSLTAESWILPKLSIFKKTPRPLWAEINNSSLMPSLKLLLNDGTSPFLFSFWVTWALLTNLTNISFNDLEVKTSDFKGTNL